MKLRLIKRILFTASVAVLGLAVMCLGSGDITAREGDDMPEERLVRAEGEIKEPGQITVIPLPTEIKRQEGNFTILPGFRIIVDSGNSELKELGEYCAVMLRASSGLDIPVTVSSSGDQCTNALKMTLSDKMKSLGREGYLLETGRDGINLSAFSPAGLFYGVQTLGQLFPPPPGSNSGSGGHKSAAVPCMTIRDIPRYPYRGMHLDVCRHFFPKEFIKKYLDLLALHKFNTFHWHLTDDQGWRIEIRKYPLLAEKAGIRRETIIGSAREEPQRFDGKPYRGFYSREDIREIVEYAKKRYITIIPEIEIPGHSVAALSAYPELSCTGRPFEVATKWGVFKDVYCAGNEKVFEFLEDVLGEVIELFPGTYIHVGGDECPKDRWKKCERCQARIRNEGLKDENELQSYFIRRIEKILTSRGRKLIGWDEILEGGLAPEATVMSWRGTKGGISAARQRHDVIMTPASHCYFDYYQADRKTEPLAIGGFIPLEKVYSFEPTPPGLSADEAAHILGAQGNVWTEYICTPEQVEYMSVPRMSALAEVVWSPAGARDWKNFQKRLSAHFRLLDAIKVNYCRKTAPVKGSSD